METTTLKKETVRLPESRQPGHFDVEKIRADFPILQRPVYGKPLAYLDNAATTQKPLAVIEAIRRYYNAENANIHRGVYHLSEVATRKYEGARKTVKNFLNAASEKEIVFTAGTTDSINLVAAAYGRKFIKAGDEIILSHMEHHSNIVPWQMLCEETGAKLRVIPINDRGELIFEAYEKLLNERTRLVSIVYVSNSLGTVNPVKEIIALAHQGNVPVLVDGAQAVAHLKVDVQDLDCDFFALSGHKIFGPTGVGVLYAKEKILESMNPYRGGGDMIRSVKFEKTVYAELPHRFEAGTPHIAGVIGLAKALEYVESVGFEAIGAYEKALLEYGQEALSALKKLKLIGTAREKAGVISFVIEGIHPHDIGTWVDRQGVAIRAGHHCTQPVMERYGVPSTCRASLAMYNCKEDFDTLITALHDIIKVFD
ncbi:MAG: cysteine desulfurase [Calditrichaceae bacterium]|nr:cysteine desulfurase [Calditrichia bacterium]NUQ41072.1 cysteine desulfurase [Calditrichaceae bacterium]